MTPSSIGILTLLILTPESTIPGWETSLGPKHESWQVGDQINLNGLTHDQDRHGVHGAA